MSERINHPPHYQTVPGIECIEVVRHFNFNLGNVIKYVWRAGSKEGVSDTEDLKKAIWYLQDEVTRREGKREPVSTHNPEPKWEYAPSWAEWWAIDEDGQSSYYNIEPLIGPLSKAWTPNGKYYSIEPDEKHKQGTFNWKSSKRRRPE
jgi:hypothetical protein